MAQSILEDEAPESFEAALLELSPLHMDYPTLTKSQDKHAFTEVATFADEIKEEGGMF